MNTRFKFPLAGVNRQPYYCCAKDCCGFCNANKLAREVVVSWNGGNFVLPINCAGLTDIFCFSGNGNVSDGPICKWSDSFSYGTASPGGGPSGTCLGSMPLTLTLTLQARVITDALQHVSFPIMDLIASLAVGGSWSCTCFSGRGTSTFAGEAFYYRSHLLYTLAQSYYCCGYYPRFDTNATQNCIDFNNISLDWVGTNQYGSSGVICGSGGANCSCTPTYSSCLTGLVSPVPSTATVVNAY